MLGFDCDSLMGLMETFDAMSSLIGFDVSERGTIGLMVLIIAMRGGELARDSGGAPMMGDKFVD